MPLRIAIMSHGMLSSNISGGITLFLTRITAFVPLEMMFGYATDVRSLTKGRASYSMEPSHFEQVPSNLLQQIVESSSRAAARS